MDSAGSRERALAQYGRASLAIGRVSHAGGGGEERLARDCCRAFLQHCSSDPGGGCGTHGRRVGMAVRACRLPRLTPTCVSDTRALALAPQVREFMRVLDQRASANTAKTNAANKVNTINIINTANKVNVVSSGDGLATTAPGKVQNEPTSPPSTATPRVESEQTAVHVLTEDPVNDVTPRVPDISTQAKVDPEDSTATPGVLAVMAARMDRLEHSLTDGLQRLQSLVSRPVANVLVVLAHTHIASPSQLHGVVERVEALERRAHTALNSVPEKPSAGAPGAEAAKASGYTKITFVHTLRSPTQHGDPHMFAGSAA